LREDQRAIAAFGLNGLAIHLDVLVVVDMDLRHFAATGANRHPDSMASPRCETVE